MGNQPTRSHRSDGQRVENNKYLHSDSNTASGIRKSDKNSSHDCSFSRNSFPAQKDQIQSVISVPSSRMISDRVPVFPNPSLPSYNRHFPSFSFHPSDDGDSDPSKGENIPEFHQHDNAFKANHSFGGCRTGHFSSASTIAANPALGPWQPPLLGRRFGELNIRRRGSSSALHVRGEVISASHPSCIHEDDEEQTPRLVNDGSDTTSGSEGYQQVFGTRGRSQSFSADMTRPEDQNIGKANPSSEKRNVTLITGRQTINPAVAEFVTDPRLLHGARNNRVDRLDRRSIPPVVQQRLTSAFYSAGLPSEERRDGLTEQTDIHTLKRGQSSSGRIEIFLKPMHKGYAVKSYRVGDRYEG